MPVLVDPGGWKSVANFIATARAKGCELRSPNISVMTPWGKKRFRYLYNPNTDGAFDISDLEEDEFIGPSIVQAAERRLGVQLRD